MLNSHSVQMLGWKFILFLATFQIQALGSVITKQGLQNKDKIFQKPSVTSTGDNTALSIASPSSVSPSVPLAGFDASDPDDASAYYELIKEIVSTAGTNKRPQSKKPTTVSNKKFQKSRKLGKKSNLPNCSDLKWPFVTAMKIPPCLSYRQQLERIYVENESILKSESPTLLSAPKSPTRGIRPPMPRFNMPPDDLRPQPKAYQDYDDFDENVFTDEPQDFPEDDFDALTSSEEEEDSFEDNFIKDRYESEKF